MKVVCEYCGSYVEADENMKCPSCCAELGSAVRAVQAKAEQDEEEARSEEQRQKAEEARENCIGEIIKGVAGVATAVATGAAFTGAHGASRHEPAPPHDRRFDPFGGQGPAGPSHHMPPLGGPGAPR